MFNLRLSPGLLERLLGGSLDILGDELTKLTGRGVKYLKQRRQFARILRSLRDKSRPDDEAPVNPRALKDAIESGILSSDELVAEYYGGLLASSRALESKDDTSAFYSALVKALAAEQLRGHWILYSVLFTYYRGRKDINVYQKKGRDSMTILIPWRIFLFLFQCLDDDEMRGKYTFRFPDNDKTESSFCVSEDAAEGITHFQYNVGISATYVDGSEVLLAEGFSARLSCPRDLLRRFDVVFWGLLKEELVERLFWGDESVMVGEPLSFAKEGIVFRPSVLGIDLFLRAQGIKPISLLRDCFESLAFHFEPKTLEKAILQDVMEVAIQDDAPSGGPKARVVPRSKGATRG
jgi:hypothetical protein